MKPAPELAALLQAPLLHAQHLLVVVGALEELDAGVQRPAVSLDEDLDAVDGRIEGVRAESTALDGHSGSQAIVRGHVDVFGDYMGRDRELDLADVADGDSVGPAGCLNHGTERPELAVLDLG